MRTLPQQLEAAYRATSYRLFGCPTGDFVIRCGRRSSQLDRLLERHAAAEWAFVTACNPRSRRLDDQENAARMERLEATLLEAGYCSLPGAGEANDNSWPPEPSLLVLGIAETEALALAATFDQHAILVGRRGKPARLVWIPAGEGDRPCDGPSLPRSVSTLLRLPQRRDAAGGARPR